MMGWNCTGLRSAEIASAAKSSLQKPLGLSVASKARSRSPVRIAPLREVRYAKRPVRGALRSVSRWRAVRDCEPHPWGSPLRAAHSGADLRSSKFIPDEFVEPGKVRPPPLSARYAKRCFGGVHRWREVREGLFGPSMGQTPARSGAARRACGSPKLSQTILSRHRVRPPPLSARYTKRCFGGVRRWREVREGLFGPSMGQTPAR